MTCVATLGDIHLDRDLKQRAHARTHDLPVVQVNAPGTQQAAQLPEPGQCSQDRAQVAGIPGLVQINGPLARARRGYRQHRHYGDQTLWSLRLGQLRHLRGGNDMRVEGTAPLRVLSRDIQHTAAQSRIQTRGFLQLEQRMLALDQEVPQLLAVFPLVKHSGIVELHDSSRCGICRCEQRAGDGLRHLDAIDSCGQDTAGVAGTLACRIQTTHVDAL